MSRRITCIQCPMGCVMNVGFAENGEVTSVEGNSCGRGKKYAQAEATNPVRTVCGTVCAAGCLEPVSYRTSAPVPKALAGDVAREAAGLSLCAPIASGDVICENVCGTVCARGCLEPVSYRTSAPVPKALAGDVARKAAGLTLCAPIASGDVICENVCGTGISLIATKSIG